MTIGGRFSDQPKKQMPAFQPEFSKLTASLKCEISFFNLVFFGLCVAFLGDLFKITL